MTESIQIHSRVGKDGVLSLRIPLGLGEADSDVVVTIASTGKSVPREREEPHDWHEFVERTYGSCAGLGLERPEQGTLETREVIE